METINKGKAGQIGEIRTRAGKKYQKTAKGWRPVVGGNKGSKSPEFHQERESITEKDLKEGNFKLVDASLSKEISDYKNVNDYKKEEAALEVKDGKVSFVSKVLEYKDRNMGSFYKTDVDARLDVDIPEDKFKQIIALAKDKGLPDVSFSSDWSADYKRLRSEVRVWRERSGLVLNVYTFGTYGVSAGVKQKRMSGTSDCFGLLLKDYMKKLGIAVSE